MRRCEFEAERRRNCVAGLRDREHFPPSGIESSVPGLYAGPTDYPIDDTIVVMLEGTWSTLDMGSTRKIRR